MLKGKVRRVLLVILMLFLSACSQTQPQVAKEKSACSEVKEQKRLISLAKLSLSSKEVSNQKENWVPLKVEDEIEWNARELLGLKYVWGATGPTAYDCSGFTRKIFGDVGIYLPRVSRDQAKIGQLVSFHELKKGDLVFFATKRRYPHRVTHVGIYLGNGNFIHASSGAKKVVICNFNKHCFYKKRFLWGRRVITEQHRLARVVNSPKKVAKSL